MPISNYPNGISSFGIPVMGGGGIPATFGEVWFVDYRNGSDDNDGKSRESSFKTLSQAYAKAVSNRNDVILIDGDSTVVEAAAIDWTKNRIHVIGLDGAPRMIQQGAKIQSTNGAGDAYLLKVTGTRNSFQNLKFIQADQDSAALTCVQMGGEGNAYINCHFTLGTAANIDGAETTTYEVVCGEDSGTFINCEFGTPTLLGTGARAVMAIDAVNGTQEMKDCRFKDCRWVIASTSASADMIRVIDTAAAKFTNIFENPIMQASIVGSASAITLDDAVRSVSGLVEGELLFVNPATNCTEFCSDVTDQVKVIGWGMDGTNPEQKIGIALTPA